MVAAPPARRSKSASFSAATSEAPPQASKLASTWTTLPGGIVDGGEIVILAIKPSLWRPLLESLPVMLTCCIIGAVLTGFDRRIPGLSHTTTAQITMLAAFARLGFAVVRWVPAWYVLTNRRAIEIRGVRAPRITTCLLVEVGGTSLLATPAEKLTRIGTITFAMKDSSQASQMWQSINKPQEVHHEIRRAIDNAIDHRTPSA